jgi:hypothetical protein
MQSLFLCVSQYRRHDAIGQKKAIPYSLAVNADTRIGDREFRSDPPVNILTSWPGTEP